MQTNGDIRVHNVKVNRYNRINDDKLIMAMAIVYSGIAFCFVVRFA